MSTITLKAESREMLGKGASRRLRRLEGKVPGIVYGGNKKAQPLHFLHKDLIKTLESESTYSSVLDLVVDGKKAETVILKALQRHPYKPVILHLDLQRVSAKSILDKLVPLHFLNEETAKGVKEGGMIQHNITQLEIRCEARNLPEYIEVDMQNVGLDEVIHLSDIKLPSGVDLTVDLSDESHNMPVVSIHMPKAEPVEEEIEEETSAAEEAAATEETSEEKPEEGSAE
jgi:large subunit ribosomal protein L25